MGKKKKKNRQVNYMLGHQWRLACSRPNGIQELAANTSTTQLKKMLYSLINKRDKLQASQPKQEALFPIGTPRFKMDLEKVIKSIEVVAEELSHRKLAQLFPETTND